MGVSEADAEELAADVLLKVEQSVGRFVLGGAARFTTWIFQIARNRAIDYHRNSWRAAEQFQAFTDALSQQSGKCFAGGNQEALAWLQQHLSSLSPDDRDILMWRSSDFSFAQIGSWLDIPEGTARQRYNRALNRLKAEGQKGASQHE